MSALTPRLTPGLVDRWFERVLTPPAEPGTRWPLAVDLTVSAAERELLHSVADVLRRVVDEPADAPVIGHAVGGTSGGPGERATDRVASFLAAATAAIGDTRRTLAQLAVDRDGGGDDGIGATAGHGVDEDALAVAAGINAGAAALVGGPDGPAARGAGTGSGEPTAAEAARRAGEAAAEAAVGGADLSAVAGRAASAMLAGWGPAGPASGGPAALDTDRRTRAVIGRLLVGLQDVTRPPDPPAAPAPCGAGPGDVLGRAFLAEITCETAVPAAQVATLRAELAELADLVRVWPRSASEPGAGGWQRVHVHTDRPGPVIEALYAGGSVFDLRVTALD